MKLSTKSRYGLKAIYQIAKSDEIVTLTELSKSIGVSAAYLEQLMRLLKKSNVVKSTRGASGGYRLAKPVEEITVGEIMRSLEDNLELVDCISGTPCTSSCPTRVIWKKIYDSINETLDQITLKDMVDDKVN